jgi:hypothetical protein
VTDRLERRDFINISLAAAGGAMGMNALAAFGRPLAKAGGPPQTKTLPLEQLDLSRLQVDPAPAPGDSPRSEGGVRLPPGSSLWIDLKGAASSFAATVKLEPGSGKRSILCRFSTGAESRELVVWARGWSPKSVTLPLTGQETLIIETEAVESMDCVTVVLSNASITYSGAEPETFIAEPIVWETREWRLKIDGKSGSIVQISNPRDPYSMNWIRPVGRWGTGLLRIGFLRDAWLRPARMERPGPRSMALTYHTSALKVRVQRRIDRHGLLRESYTFTNTTTKKLNLGKGAVGILMPLNDRYPGADICLTRCCNVHLWPGGHSAYICAIRMGGAAPHLGLVLMEGAVTNYSIENRPEGSNDRGWMALHPEAMILAPGESRAFSWALFWHKGWDDFFARARAMPGFVRLEADQYTVPSGQSVRITASAASSLKRAKLFANGQAIDTGLAGHALKAEFLPESPGEQTIEFRIGGKRTLLRALVVTPPMDLIRRRVEFIIRHQQKRSPGDPLDGAYLIYDNETNEQVYGPYDHDAGRERVGMGVLVAMYLPLCRDNGLRGDLTASLERYDGFVRRELENESGTVYDDVGRQKTQRLYNYPWVAHLHLAIHQATREQDSLRRFVRTCRKFYEIGGERFYPIGMPILSGLSALENAAWKGEQNELLALFRRHADAVLKTGTAYPKSEVNYEQSIVGPGVQILLETYLATKEPAYLEGARKQLECLEAFNGRQPDYHLNDIAIRHWDDYWFGKRQLYGDTQPHYWSTITAVAFNLYAKATGDESYARRARQILLNNLCYFSADGRAYCAYVNPLTVNGRPGQFFDPWANDQDWTLVNWLVTQRG